MIKVGKVAAISSVCLFAGSLGCARITARSLEPFSWEPEGIPFYLPKPYLIVAKNIRYIPTPTTGLTETVPIPNSFDPAGNEVSLVGTVGQTRSIELKRTMTSTLPEQPQEPDKPDKPDEPGDTGDDDASGENSESELQSARAESSEDKEPGTETGGGKGSGTEVTTTTTGGGSGYGKQILTPPTLPLSPSGFVPDGLMPHTFYTYQIVYLPDLTQKYGLTIYNGSGEFRATMNLINGWMHTGAGPLYMRDSTTAASLFAGGMSTSNVIDSVAGLGLAGASTAAAPGLAPTLAKILSMLPGPQLQTAKTSTVIQDYAEIYVFEPYLTKDEHGKKFMAWRPLPGTPVKFDRDIGRGASGKPSKNGDAAGVSKVLKSQIDAIVKKYKDAQGTPAKLLDVVPAGDAYKATIDRTVEDFDGLKEELRLLFKVTEVVVKGGP